MNPVRKPFLMNLPEFVLMATDLFIANNKELYVVGGAVRDAVLGVQPKDFDLATNATPDEVVAIFQKIPGVRILELGKTFGVIMVITENGEEYEIATFRSDLGAGRRPDAVVFTSIDQDVLRRDLTINALFYDLATRDIVDYVGGLADIARQAIRTVGNPEERFAEDRLRILRALRFAARLDFELDATTSRAILADNSLAGVSGERIRDEFLKGLKGSVNPEFFLKLVQDHGLWSQVFPELTVVLAGPVARDVSVQLAWLLRTNEPAVLTKALNQLKYSAVEVAQVAFLVALQNLSIGTGFRLKKMHKNSHLNPSQIIEFSFWNPLVNSALIEPFLSWEFSVTGEQLMAEGFSGKQIGQEQVSRETELFRKIAFTV